MSTLGLFALIAFGLFVLAALSPPARRFAKSLIALGNAQADRAADSLANVDPLGVFKTQIANAVSNLGHANSVLQNAAKQIVSLDRQIDADTQELTKLTNRLQTVVDNGDPNNTANDIAVQIAAVEARLGENKSQRDSAKSIYDENLELVETFQRNIKNARNEAEQLGLQLERSEAEKNLVQMSSSLKGKLDVGGDFNEARRRIQASIDANKGSVKAARDLSRQDLAEESDLELERKAAAQKVLERFQKPVPTTPAATAPVTSDQTV